MEKAQLTIAHLISVFLPVTQNWMYNQLVFNKECSPVVLCQRTEHLDQFPLQNVYPICKKTGLISVPSRALHKLFQQYPLKPHIRIVDSFKPVLFHGHFMLESWRNFSLVKKTGIPLVTTLYGQDVSELWRRPFWRERYRKVFSHGAAFIVEGDHMKSAVVALGCPSEKITVVKIGIDLSRIVSSIDHKENAPVRFLFVGLGREKKGAEVATRAFAQIARDLTNIEIHFIGDGIYRVLTENILKEAGVRDRAVYHGTVSVAKYLEILGQSNILLAPSVHAADGDTEGGAPVTIIEALAAGIPVVGTDHCDIPDIVQHQKSGLLCKERDVDALAENMETLARNRSLRAQMGASGREYARREHDINLQVKKITEVYRGVLKDTM